MRKSVAIKEETLQKQRLAAAKKLREQLQRAQASQRTQNEQAFSDGAQELKAQSGALAALGLSGSGYARSKAQQAVGEMMRSLEDTRAQRAQTQAKVERDRKDEGIDNSMIGDDYKYQEQPVNPRYSDKITKELLKRLLRRQAGLR